MEGGGKTAGVSGRIYGRLTVLNSTLTVTYVLLLKVVKTLHYTFDLVCTNADGDEVINIQHSHWRL